MTQLHEHDYDDVLRRALHSAADLVEPSADGLERIRARLTTPRPPLLAWVIVGYSEVVRPVLGYGQPLVAWLQATLGPVIERFRPARPDAAHPQRGYAWLQATLGPVIERFRPARPDAAHPRRRYAWLRPAAAMATAVFVVAMGAFALTALPQVISQSGAFILPIISGGSGGHQGSPRAFGSGSHFSAGTTPTGASAGMRTGANQRRSGCTPSKSTSTRPSTTPSPSSSSPSPSTSASTSPSTSPSPTTTPSPTPTPTPTPTTTGSSTPSPAGGTSSPGAPAADDTPIATPDPGAVANAAVPAGAMPSSPSATCKPTGSPTKAHISITPGNGAPAISHAMAHRPA